MDSKLMNEQNPTELSDEQLESVTGGYTSAGAYNSPTIQQTSFDFEHQNNAKIIENPTAAVKDNDIVNPFPEKKPFIFKP